MNDCQPRILILSHNALSRTQNNGKTMEALLGTFDSKQLAQIYLQPETPDFSFCSNYYCMTDYEALSNVVFHGDIGNAVIYKQDFKEISSLAKPIANLYKSRRNGIDRKGLNKFFHEQFVNRKPIFVAGREIIWHFAKWKNSKLINWVNAFQPNVLFFQGSSCAFGYDIALWLCDQFDLPLILELTDDYTYRQYRFSPSEFLNKKRYLQRFKEAVRRASMILPISDDMAAEYSHRYGGQYMVVQNAVLPRLYSYRQYCNNNITMLYAGNVSIGRWEVLCKVGSALQAVRSRYGINVTLKIYTPTPIETQYLSAFNGVDTIFYGGSLNQEQLSQEICDSDILVHVESFDKKVKKITRLSISTKIPEYLASNRCIYAVGPKDVASIRYLMKYQAAQVSTDADINELISDMYRLFSNEELQKTIMDNAKELYLARHQLQSIQDNVRSAIFKSICYPHSVKY